MTSREVEPIAIVGMAVRVPGASTLDEYFELLVSNRCVIEEIPPQRWRGHAGTSGGRGAVVGGFIEGIEMFDARSFGISPREASRMDPQQRVLLELAAEAFDDAGRSRKAMHGSATGVWVGAMWSDFLAELLVRPSMIDPYTVSGATLSFVANRISFAFGLEGPSIVVDAACASSLVAIHDACNALRLRECDFALAGGVNVMLSPQTMQAMDAAGVLSRAGICRPLDDACDGFVRGEGGGLLLLKRASDIEPWERVHAVIRGSAVNHNGRGPWVMAPSSEAQTKVIRMALQRAGIGERGLDYVELHGTGFRLGDVVETRALCDALGAAAERCRIGSVKGNVGNLESAAGIASLIKVVLALARRTKLPTPNLTVLNSGVTDATPQMQPQRNVEPWSDVDRPIAGVTACSYSGTNAHVIVEAPERSTVPEAETVMLPFAAATPQALISHLQSVLDALNDGTLANQAPANLAAALARRHPEGPCRVVVVGEDWADLRNTLEVALHRTIESSGFLSSQPVDRDMRVRIDAFLEHGVLDVKSFPGPISSAPSLPWARRRMWLDALREPVVGGSPDIATNDRISGRTMQTPAVDFVCSWSRELEQLASSARVPYLIARITDEARRLLESPDDVAIPDDRPFFELGVTSVALAGIRSILTRELGIEVPLPRMYHHPTIRALAQAALALWSESSPSSDSSSIERELLRRLERIEAR